MIREIYRNIATALYEGAIKGAAGGAIGAALIGIVVPEARDATLLIYVPLGVAVGSLANVGFSPLERTIRRLI